MVLDMVHFNMVTVSVYTVHCEACSEDINQLSEKRKLWCAGHREAYILKLMTNFLSIL